MKKWKTVLSFALACSLLFSSCSILNGIIKNGDNSSSQEEVNMPIRILSPKDGARVVLANEYIADFVASYERYGAETYAYKGDRYEMVGVDLSWEADEELRNPSYVIEISENEDLSNALFFETDANSLHIDDLFVNTVYYWRVFANYGDRGAYSSVQTFRTVKTPRTLKIDGVSNTRDIGGIALENGKQIKQGMVYRGGSLDGITENGKISALETYGIKTDLDLRNMAEGTAGGVSPLGTEINYVHVNASPYYTGTAGIDKSENWNALATSMRVFADKQNYPVYVHCSLGRDRTSAVCFLLEALLGATEEDMFMDYETSFFSKMGDADGQTVLTMVNNFKKMYDYISTKNSGDGSMAERCERFLIDDLGLTQAEVNAIRENLIK